MPVSKKKRTTSESVLSTSETSCLPLPEQQEFHQHLRALAQSAVRTVLELVMREVSLPGFRRVSPGWS